jgi:hypothetical protein
LEGVVQQVLAQTSNGGYYYVDNPKAEHVSIEEIALALSHLCRFGGHTRFFYSVAEHCINVSHCVPKNMAMWGLLHDASEAYVCDLPSPLKSLLPEYKAIEDKHHRAIAEKFGLSWPMPAEVKDADRRVLLAERDVLLGREAFPWDCGNDPHPLCMVVGMRPQEARERFLARFNYLKGQK